MERYVSQPLQVPAPNALYSHDRVDLELHGVEHSGGSFAVRVFVNLPDADSSTATDTENKRYAGSFYIFGHGPCLGDEGHCAVRTGPIHPYDFRPAHPLMPQYHRLPITKALRANAAEDTFTVTLVVVANRDGNYESADLLDFSRLSVIAYS
ncbi:MAG: hypothetical protein WAU42_05300 [Solirubrobacteraceae bacterium]